MLDLLLLTGAPNDAGQIDNGQRKREIDTRQHDGEENIPAADASNESKGARRLLALGRGGGAALGQVEEGAGEQAEGGDEGEEDEEEDEVGAHGADEVDEAEEAHGDHEVGCGAVSRVC